MNKVKKEHLEKAIERLLFCLWIYPNYRVDARGPTGCIFDVINLIDKNIYNRLQNEDLYDIYKELYGED